MARRLMKSKPGSSAGSSGSASGEKLMCARCNVEMVEMDLAFRYLSRDFRYKVPRCPQCGQVSLPEELVTGKMADVESMIEDK